MIEPIKDIVDTFLMEEVRTLDCVKAKGVELCRHCDDFPCAFLAPTADGAARYPQNMNIYNVCRIKRIGLKRWIEDSGQIQKMCSTGTFVVGRGRAE